MTTRREVLITGAAIATSLLAACSPETEVVPTGGTVEVPKSDVPVGGGVVLADARVVVVQPEEGTFLAYSAVCTHQHCVVREVRDDGIYCACHGSLFDSSDGSPIEGPATQPLPGTAVQDTGDVLVVST
ncbi:ubiquinol-cytochrome c reductase iron-sulfur subunit [Tessaracoccus rhinocerotis]|nr:Rieske (2Fe-2S) protein [Tessaracoccus rhinocerotis]